MPGLLALAAGACLAFAYAPYSYALVAILSPAVLFALWHQKTPSRAVWLGWLYGVGMFGHGVWWLQVSIHRFGLPVYAFSISMTVLFVFGMALYPALVGYAVRRLPAPSESARLLGLAPALWTLGEWLRGWLFTGFPWLHLGYSQTDTWLRGYLPVFGAHGASIAVGMLAALLAWTRYVPPRRWLRALLAGAIILGAGAMLDRVEWTHAQGTSRAVALIQGAVPQQAKWQPEFRRPTIELYSYLSEPFWGRAVVVWPETAIPAFPDEIPTELTALGHRADATGTALLVGIPTGDRHGGDYFNSVMLLGAHTARYDKYHLVPFGEYLPFDRWVRPVLDFLTIPMSSFASGPAHQPPLIHGDLRIGATICYEDAYGTEVAKALPDANLLANVSDDAWFGDSIAPHQHLQIARVRAIETGRSLLRATNTGISAIIDARGRVQARSAQFEPAVVSGEVDLREGATPFVRWLNAPVVGLCGLLVLWNGIGGRRRNVRSADSVQT